MTPLQKQILLLEEQRQNEEQQKQAKQGQSPAGPLNARHSQNGYTQKIHYENSKEYETENQAEFVE